MRPTPVERCRVLELACGEGANLVPLAYTLPDSTFLGQDPAPTQIATGQRFTDELGLKNLKLEALDLLQFPASAPRKHHLPPPVRWLLALLDGQRDRAELLRKLRDVPPDW